MIGAADRGALSDLYSDNAETSVWRRTASLKKTYIWINMMIAVGGSEHKICHAKGEKQQQCAVVSQNWLSAAFFFPVRADNIWNCCQRKKKWVNSKSFQNKVLCDKKIDNAAI